MKTLLGVQIFPYLCSAFGSMKDEKGTWVRIPDSPAAVFSVNLNHVVATGHKRLFREGFVGKRNESEDLPICQ